ncbi:hypothetical protein KR51_00037230 [Rubidibacter lacunae KORDI 51-2]|uniref:Uncharacterized protein n=1 Tax=Rubidibacter lacunae KORDI 51-2 TaxID=582515 RepID=U5DDV6_9CHRO|nr:hypothetical protein [Rubidibacter lacunae]ERN39811.1 hypothetical protein KR51_00037230 [Rubidibacter lacunae KORDI 51-2]
MKRKDFLKIPEPFYSESDWLSIQLTNVSGSIVFLQQEVVVMSYITWVLDTEDGFDAYDPLGKIVILGDEGNIEESNTYLDAFFEALAEGAKHIKSGEVIVIDPLIEPDVIVFDFTLEKLVVNYGIWKAVVSDKEKFMSDLRRAVQEFVTILDELVTQQGQKKRALAKLRNFLDETHD